MRRHPEDAATVQTTCGLVRGTLVEGVHAYLGVPYAAPPIGPMRFAAPARHEPWHGIRDADRFGATVPQPEPRPGLFTTGATVIEGDDCLHANIYTPAPGPTGLPVLVWIHGGGFVIGCNADAWSQGARLAQRGMVVVALNYRLGVDGFLPLRDAPHNRGVLDWIAALEWVQDNIAAFGGDPGNVTIGGQSAGSYACLTLLATPRASGMFRRVFAMSGVPFNVVDLAESTERAEELAARLGVLPTADGLASAPLRQLFAAQQEMAPPAGIPLVLDPSTLFRDMAAWRLWLGPVVDGELLPEHPMVRLSAVAGDSHDMLIGSTCQEMDALVGVVGGGMARDEAEDALVGIGLGVEVAKRWLDATGASPGYALGAALTAMTVRLPVVHVAQGRFGTPGRTFVYEVTWRPPTPLGAVHAIDLPYVFDTIDAEGVALMAGGEPPRSLAQDLSGSVTRFVLDGDPGWPAYAENERAVMCFGLPSMVQNDPDELVRDVFTILRPPAGGSSTDEAQRIAAP